MSAESRSPESLNCTIAFPCTAPLCIPHIRVAHRTALSCTALYSTVRTPELDCTDCTALTCTAPQSPRFLIMWSTQQASASASASAAWVSLTADGPEVAPQSALAQMIQEPTSEPVKSFDELSPEGGPSPSSLTCPHSTHQGPIAATSLFQTEQRTPPTATAGYGPTAGVLRQSSVIRPPLRWRVFEKFCCVFSKRFQGQARTLLVTSVSRVALVRSSPTGQACGLTRRRLREEEGPGEVPPARASTVLSKHDDRVCLYVTPLATVPNQIKTRQNGLHSNAQHCVSSVAVNSCTQLSSVAVRGTKFFCNVRCPLSLAQLYTVVHTY